MGEHTILTKREAADALRCSERQIDRLRVAGRLPAFHVNSGVRFKRGDVLALIEPAPRKATFGAALARVSDDARELPEFTRRPAVRV